MNTRWKRNTTARSLVESYVVVDRGRAVSTLGGIAPGDHWVDAGGAVHVVAWVRKIGIVGYRPAADHTGSELVMDIVRFVRTFAPLNESTTDRAA